MSATNEKPDLIHARTCLHFHHPAPHPERPPSFPAIEGQCSALGPAFDPREPRFRAPGGPERRRPNAEDTGRETRFPSVDDPSSATGCGFPGRTVAGGGVRGVDEWAWSCLPCRTQPPRTTPPPTPDDRSSQPLARPFMNLKIRTPLQTAREFLRSDRRTARAGPLRNAPAALADARGPDHALFRWLDRWENEGGNWMGLAPIAPHPSYE